MIAVLPERIGQLAASDRQPAGEDQVVWSGLQSTYDACGRIFSIVDPKDCVEMQELPGGRRQPRRIQEAEESGEEPGGRHQEDQSPEGTYVSPALPTGKGGRGGGFLLEF